MGKLKWLTFGFLALDFPHQFSSLSFVCPRATLNQLHALAHPVRGWEDQKLVMLFYGSGINCSCPWITWAGDKEVSKPQFYFCPDQQLVVWPFASHLTALSLSVKWGWRSFGPLPVSEGDFIRKGEWRCSEQAAQGTCLGCPPVDQIHKRGWSQMGTHDFSIRRCARTAGS